MYEVFFFLLNCCRSMNCKKNLPEKEASPKRLPETLRKGRSFPRQTTVASHQSPVRPAPTTARSVMPKEAPGQCGCGRPRTIPYHPWDSYIYLREWLICMVNASYTDAMGIVKITIFVAPSLLKRDLWQTVSFRKLVGWFCHVLFEYSDLTILENRNASTCMNWPKVFRRKCREWKFVFM